MSEKETAAPEPIMAARVLDLLSWIEDYALADPDLGEVARRAGEALLLLNQPWPTEAVCRLIHDVAGTKDADEPMHHPAQNSWEEPSLQRWQQWEELSDELHELLRGKSSSKTLPDTRHKFSPHKEYPWFCASCGYAPHEQLMHDQTTNPSFETKAGR